MNDVLNRFTSLVRKAVDEYRMLDDGDAVAVGLSGGKDSLPSRPKAPRSPRPYIPISRIYMASRPVSPIPAASTSIRESSTTF